MTTTILPQISSPDTSTSNIASTPLASEKQAIVNSAIMNEIEPSLVAKASAEANFDQTPTDNFSPPEDTPPVSSSKGISNNGENNSLNNLPTFPTDNNQIKPSIQLQQKLQASNPTTLAKKISQNVSHEIQQHFESQWNPPENLKQSIEYRLQVNDDGSLSKITPVGQISAIFLEQTEMPLVGEVITSSFAEVELSALTVRLILAPNGNVETFVEQI